MKSERPSNSRLASSCDGFPPNKKSSELIKYPLPAARVLHAHWTARRRILTRRFPTWTSLVSISAASTSTPNLPPPSADRPLPDGEGRSEASGIQALRHHDRDGLKMGGDPLVVSLRDIAPPAGDTSPGSRSGGAVAGAADHAGANDELRGGVSHSTTALAHATRFASLRSFGRADPVPPSL